MSILQTITGAGDVGKLPTHALPLLADEIRNRIIAVVSRNGGHLASNLGVVDLTVALLRVFNPPTDKIVWDVGHQTYAWKLLTGRGDRFDTLRQPAGLSGFQKRAESPCDAFGAGHAGTAISAAMGMAAARDRRGGRESVIAIVGDAALGNGISLEALNTLATVTRRLIVILNDNEMSIGGPVGAISSHLGRLLANPRYNRWKAAAEHVGHRLRMDALRGIYHRTEQAIKSLFLKNALFEEFGLRYMGPVDGHDLGALCDALTVARSYDRPILIHVSTLKGRGHRPAELNPEAWHGVGCFDPEGDEAAPAPRGYSHVLGERLCTLAKRDPSVVAITAAMCGGTGLTGFAQQFPDRFFDVGICEEHAVVFAAGLAAEGMRPFVAIYSTFMQRAVDCVMHDVCLQGLPVVFCLDRAGVVGSDGPTHHGVFDIAMLRCLPNLVFMQPRDEAELTRMLETAVRHPGPVVIRYPRDPAGAADAASTAEPLPVGVAEVVEPLTGDGPPVWIWALGDFVALACGTAARLRERGVAAGVVNARFIKPIDRALLLQQAELGARFVTLENGSIAGGFGSALAEELDMLGVTNARVHRFGWPDRFIPQGTTAGLREQFGLTPEALAQTIGT
jgi:1-deoxy-D-xylulose-5-phosphate synthase